MWRALNSGSLESRIGHKMLSAPLKGGILVWSIIDRSCAEFVLRIHLHFRAHVCFSDCEVIFLCIRTYLLSPHIRSPWGCKCYRVPRCVGKACQAAGRRFSHATVSLIHPTLKKKNFKNRLIWHRNELQRLGSSLDQVIWDESAIPVGWPIWDWGSTLNEYLAGLS